MSQQKISKKKVTFSDYDEVEIIDEWALVYRTEAKKPRKSIVSKKPRNNDLRTSLLSSRENLKHRKALARNKRKIGLESLRKLKTVKASSLQKKLRLKKFQHRLLKKVGAKISSNPAVKPPTKPCISLRKSLPSLTLCEKYSRPQVAKHIHVDLTSPRKKEQFSAHESLNIYYKTGTVRSPLHAPKESLNSSTLTVGNMRKHTLRQNRSISNESLVGGLISGKRSCVSNYTLLKQSKVDEPKSSMTPHIGQVLCNLTPNGGSTLSMTSPVRGLANLSVINPALSIFGETVLNRESITPVQQFTSNTNLNPNNINKTTEGEQFRSDLEETISLAQCSTDEFSPDYN
ncbi:unnamed protein product [Moneuplotes crassus]|uniref:Uncharacterized protein n=1 Tax=Euplotes crassus TaxID=5936 RepID=A0AAD1UC67_EUPCR|nr:unnamed protein product [Moneuplotes crassus]